MRYTLSLVSAALFSTASIVSAQARAPLHWEPAPSVLPAGAQMAIISGNPEKSGPFVIQLAMPAGYRIPPHTHPNDETIRVLKGHFLIGMGDTWNQKSTRRMAAGSKVTVKNGMAHYGATEGASVVSIAAEGPFAITYVNPADDPTKTVAVH